MRDTFLITGLEWWGKDQKVSFGGSVSGAQLRLTDKNLCKGGEEIVGERGQSQSGRGRKLFLGAPDLWGCAKPEFELKFVARLIALLNFCVPKVHG